MRASHAWILLLLFCGLLGVLGWGWIEDHPFPPRSNHLSYRMVPRLTQQFTGYQSCPDSLRLSLGHFSTAFGPGLPRPIENPADLLRELKEGGRLWPLVGVFHNRDFWTNAPHAFAMPALVATFLPGHPTLARFTHTIYFLLLIVGTYGIAARFVRRDAALVGAFFAGASPALLGYSRFVESYLPSASMATLLVWCIVASKGFSRLIPSLAVGLVAWSALRTGEGLSEGVGAGIMATLPFFWALGEGFLGLGERRRPALMVLLCLSIGIGLFLLGFDWIWAFPFQWVEDASGRAQLGWNESGWNHMLDGFQDYQVASKPLVENPSPLHRWIAWYGGYVILLVTDYLEPLLLFWLLLAIPLLLSRPKRGRWLVIAWFLIPFLAYSRMTRKALWYALPLVPPLAVMVAMGLDSIRRVRLRRWILLLAAGTAFFQILSLSLRKGPGWSLLAARALDRDTYLAIRGDELFIPEEFDRLRGELSQVVRWLDEHDAPAPGKLLHVALVSDMPAGHLSRTFAYLLQMNRPDLVVTEIAEDAILPDELDLCVDARRFKYFFVLRDNHLAACCDEQGAFVPLVPRRPSSFSFRYQRMIDSVVSRSELVRDTPPFYRVAKSE